MPSIKRLCEGVRLSTCVVVLLMIFLGAPAEAAEGDVPGCKPIIGRVVSRQGTVEIRRTGDSVWHRVERLDTQVCDGDAVRTGPRSRAALWLQPENLIRLDQRTAITIAANQAETKVEFFTGGQVSADPDCGAAYFISRFPRNFGVKTPFLSAAIKGTEFLVSAQCSATTLAVFEGIVEAQELLSGRKFLVESLQQISVGPRMPSTIPIPIKPRDGVQWTIHYPRTSARRTSSFPFAGVDCLDATATQECRVLEVEALLASGAMKEAMSVIGQLRGDESNGGAVDALEAIVKIATNDSSSALQLAQSAAKADPTNSRTWLALSYARQASVNLDAALDAANRAAALEPESSLLTSRVAEILLALGRVSEAEEKALGAVFLDAGEPRARLMLGFVRLAQARSRDAILEFQNAIELDSSEPDARLGLGLAYVRLGQLERGREEIEIAVGLDPTRANARAYLGRTYFEERTAARSKLARSQFAQAQVLDPNDPSPWFFDALQRQAENDPVGATKAINESIRLNDYRAPVRSATQLEDDRATRTAAAARTYRELGFSELALQEAMRAFAFDRQSYSAHRLLSEAYADTPRQDVSRVSEVLQAQLRQPSTPTPLSAQFTEFGLQVPRGTSPFGAGLSDFAGAFDRDRSVFQATAFAGDLATRGNQWLLGGASGPVSGAVTSYRFSTDGVRSFNGIDKEILDATFRIAPAYNLTLQGGLSNLESTYGDIPIRFDPNNYFRVVNTDRNAASFLSLRYEHFQRAETIVYVSSNDQRGGATFDNGDVLKVENTSTRVDVQETVRFRHAQAVAGASYAGGRSFEDVFGFFITSFKPEHVSAYTYLYLPVEAIRLRLEIGGTYDKVRARESGEQERANPKIGAVWTPDEKTVVRAGYFDTVKRRVVSEQMLEPVSVAGFGQYFDDLNGTRARRRGIAASRWITNTLNVGFDASERDLAVPTTNPDGTVDFDPQSERSIKTYAYLLAGSNIGVSIEYRVDDFNRSRRAPGSLGFSWLDQKQIPLSVRYFPSERLATFVSLRHLEQSGEFQVGGTPSDFFSGQERVMLVDAGVRWSLPGRRGFVSIEGRNITDEEFNYQETDPLRLRTLTRRAVVFRVLLDF